MEDYVFRMVHERTDLLTRIFKLKEFLWGDVFNELANDDKALLIEQLAFMEGYNYRLANRILRASKGHTLRAIHD